MWNHFPFEKKRHTQTPVTFYSSPHEKRPIPLLIFGPAFGVSTKKKYLRPLCLPDPYIDQNSPGMGGGGNDTGGRYEKTKKQKRLEYVVPESQRIFKHRYGCPRAVHGPLKSQACLSHGTRRCLCRSTHGPRRIQLRASKR